MRTILPHHNSFVQFQELKRQELHRKRKDAIVKAHYDVLAIIQQSKDCEIKLLRGSKWNSLSECSVLDFYKLAKKELLSFIRVRMFGDLCDSKSNELSTRKKGKPADFDALTNLEGEIGSDVTLLEMAFKMRMKPVVAIVPSPPQVPDNVVSPIPIPTVTKANANHSFTLDNSWVKNVCEYILNCKDQGDIFLQSSLSNILSLQDDLLKKMIENRLAIHLNKYQKINIGDQEWRFIFANIGRVSVILKMLQYIKQNNTLKSTRENETLLSPTFMQKHESLLDSHATQHGCYLIFDPNRGIAIGAGMASNKFGHDSKNGQHDGEYNLHKYASKQKSSSLFYTAYPHVDSPYKIDDLQRGVFQDLEFVPVIRFQHEHRENIQSLFEWDEDVVQMLEKRKPPGCKTIIDKKHILVCYLLESTLQMCLSPIDNLTENAGCEFFSSTHDKGYEEIDI